MSSDADETRRTNPTAVGQSDTGPQGGMAAVRQHPDADSAGTVDPQRDRSAGRDRVRGLQPATPEWHANLGPIKTPQMAALHEDLWDIVDSNCQDGDKAKGAVAIDAFPGLGKTTSVLAFAREFHRREIRRNGPETAAGHEHWPVCRVGLTGNTGMKDFNRAMLKFFAHPGATRGNAAHLAAPRTGLRTVL